MWFKGIDGFLAGGQCIAQKKKRFTFMNKSGIFNLL
jgi:hypothetical protein